MAGMRISVAEAARSLGVTPQTVRNMLDDGRLTGGRGNQPLRPRRYVDADGERRPIQAGGSDPLLVAEDRAPNAVVSLEDRVAALEQGLLRGLDVEAAREIALALGQSVDRQQRAMRLNAEAFGELNQAVAEQAAALRMLLMPASPGEMFGSATD